MKRNQPPSGWPAPQVVGDRVLDSGLVDEAVGVRSTTLISTRPWSVIYGVDLETSSQQPTCLVVKSLREPHHVRPGEGTNQLERLTREAETMRRALAEQIRMPRPYGVLPELGALVMERVPGETIMSRRVSERRRIAALRATGRICREWNRLDPDINGIAPVTVTVQDAANELRRLAGLLDESGIGPVTRAWWSDVIQAPVGDETELVATHGDLHTGNVFVTATGDPILIDAAVVRAPAVSDLARMCASVRTRSWSLIGGPAVRVRVERRVDALIEGFGEHDRRLTSLLELSATLGQWSDVRQRFGGGLIGRAGVRVIDEMFSRELDRWHERAVSFNLVRPS